MIIFDLDGTLADCEHRRHFVEPLHPTNIDNAEMLSYNALGELIKAIGWKPDWKAFHESCEHDKPIEPVIQIWNDQISLGMMGTHQIWSARCESVRDKTEAWLDKHLLCFKPEQLKMRPIGDNTPDDQLKERWLNELWPALPAPTEENKRKIFIRPIIDFVFDDRPKVVRMWRRRGIFVFNCAQHDGEF